MGVSSRCRSLNKRRRGVSTYLNQLVDYFAPKSIGGSFSSRIGNISHDFCVHIKMSYTYEYDIETSIVAKAENGRAPRSLKFCFAESAEV